MHLMTRSVLSATSIIRQKKNENVQVTDIISYEREESELDLIRCYLEVGYTAMI